MRALIADDDRVGVQILSRALQRLGLEVVTACDGLEAWDILRGDHPPSMAVVDWMMPGIAGPELCRRLRTDPARAGIYVILLTSRDSRADIVAGLDAGADDYLVKPFEPEEFRARVQAGIRVATLQETLAARVAELETALANVRELKGLLPICSYCKRVRTDDNYWEHVETYISARSAAEFSHGICPPCLVKVEEEVNRQLAAEPGRRPGS